jgi:tetratricopeptide (TPR) repeat protein
MDVLDFVKKYVALPLGMILQLIGYVESAFNLTGIPKTFLIASTGFLVMAVVLTWLIWFSGSRLLRWQKRLGVVALIVLSAAYFSFAQYNLLLSLRNDTFRQVMDLESARDLLGSDPGETIERLTGLMRTLPNVAELHNIRGVAYSKQNKRQEALKDFRKAAALNPKNWQYVYNLHTQLSKICDFAGAKEVLDTYVNNNRDEMRGRFERGVVHHLLGDYQAALNDYQVVVASRDNDRIEAALFNLAVIHAAKFRREPLEDRKQEHVDAAIGFLEKSVELGKASRLRKILDALEVHPDAPCEAQRAADDLTSLRTATKFNEWWEKGVARWSASSM